MTRKGTEMEKWRSHGRFSVGRGGEEWEGNIQGIRNIFGRPKIDRERLRMI